MLKIYTKQNNKLFNFLDYNFFFYTNEDCLEYVAPFRWEREKIVKKIIVLYLHDMNMGWKKKIRK